jgi:ribosomal protein S18 acetylase RimI-like enzyme
MMRFSVCDRRSDVDELALFFSRNLTASYISHSELMGYRAIRPGLWSKDILSVLRADIEKRMSDPLSQFPKEKDWLGAIEAREDEQLIAFALITISRAASVPFGIIEDLVIDTAHRGKGRGEQAMRWMVEQFKNAGIHRVFLESGVENESAHAFFKRFGFKQISMVMMYEDDDAVGA